MGSLTMDTISGSDICRSPTIVNVEVMDAFETKVSFQDEPDEVINLILKENRNVFNVEAFIGEELEDFYKEYNEMKRRIDDERKEQDDWKLTSDLLKKLPVANVSHFTINLLSM